MYSRGKTDTAKSVKKLLSSVCISLIMGIRMAACGSSVSGVLHPHCLRSPSPAGNACKLHSQRDIWSGPNWWLEVLPSSCWVPTVSYICMERGQGSRADSQKSELREVRIVLSFDCQLDSLESPEKGVWLRDCPAQGWLGGLSMNYGCVLIV